MDKIKNIIPGFILTSSIAALSIYLSNFIFIGSVAIAILIGFILNTLIINKYNIFSSGILFSENILLSVAIILLGSYMDASVISYISISNIILIILTISISILACYLFGRLFGLSRNLSILLGIGNGVCGSSAIAGASKILNSDENEIGISTTIINALGAISIIIIPGILFNFFPYFSNEQLGLVIGSTIQAFGQVTAAGFLMNQDIGEYATIIKMIRIVMLGPTLIILSFLISNQSNNKINSMFNIPYFIIGFIIISVLVSLNIIPNGITLILQKTSKILLIIAMAGIGLKISIKSILKFGHKTFLVAIIGYSIQILSIITIIILFF